MWYACTYIQYLSGRTVWRTKRTEAKVITMSNEKRSAEEMTTDDFETVLRPMRETLQLLKTYEEDERFVEPKGKGVSKGIKIMINMLKEKVRMRAYWISQQSNEIFVVGGGRAVFRKRYRRNRRS